MPRVCCFDQFADHLEVAELLDRDVLQQVADARLRAVERLHPIGAAPPSARRWRRRIAAAGTGAYAGSGFRTSTGTISSLRWKNIDNLLLQGPGPLAERGDAAFPWVRNPRCDGAFAIARSSKTGSAERVTMRGGKRPGRRWLAGSFGKFLSQNLRFCVARLSRNREPSLHSGTGPALLSRATAV